MVSLEKEERKGPEPGRIIRENTLYLFWNCNNLNKRFKERKGKKFKYGLSLTYQSIFKGFKWAFPCEDASPHLKFPRREWHIE